MIQVYRESKADEVAEMNCKLCSTFRFVSPLVWQKFVLIVADHQDVRIGR